jgi:hypothetical protein
VIPLAKTGSERTRRKAEIIILQTKSGTFSKVMSGERKLIKVTKKLIPPKIELAPAR